MWRKEDGKPQSSPENSSAPTNPTAPVIATAPAGTPAPVSTTAGGRAALASLPTSPKAAACISQGIRIKGELNGSEDLFIDGNLEGKISMGNAVITFGPNANVKADVDAREIVVRGRLQGKLVGTEKIQIWSTARVDGDLKAPRIGIEEGAELHGKMEAGKPGTGASEHLPASDSRRLDSAKTKGASSGEEKTSSGAAVAGAD
jgi:cytoskeletal protein CcmA (bactofilin family)